MKEIKREDFVRLRINEEEKRRLTEIEKLTARKRSDVVRHAIYEYIKEEYPHVLD